MEGVSDEVVIVEYEGVRWDGEEEGGSLLVGEKRPFVFCMQETKMSSCDDSLCYFLWGNPNHGYSFRPSSRALGRLLTAWDSSEVQELLPISQDHVLLIHGRFIKIDQDFYLFNVYAPCDVRAKQELRAFLTVRIQALQGKKVCFCEDFNVVRGDRWGAMLLHRMLRFLTTLLMIMS